MHLVVVVAFYLLSSLGLFCLPLPSWHVGKGGREGEEDRGGEGWRISAASVPGVLYRPQQTQEWLRGKRTGKKPIRTCLSSSLSLSISPSSLSIQRPAFNHVCVRLADTRGRTLRWVLVVHGPGRCFAVISWQLTDSPLQPRRIWFLLTCSHETDQIFIKAVLCVHRSI